MEISCNRLYEQNQYTGKKTKCIVDTQNASNCMSTDESCTYDPFNPTNLTPITIDYIKKNPVDRVYYINTDEILIIRKSDGSQTLEIDAIHNLFIIGNIYIESGATLNINNFTVYYNSITPSHPKYSSTTIINNGKLNISNPLGNNIFTGTRAGGRDICKITNNGIITFKGTNPGSINSHVSNLGIASIVAYNNIDITGTGEIIYNNTGTTYNEKMNIDNTQTLNMCQVDVQVKFDEVLSFNKPLTLFKSSFHSYNDITTSKITIDKSYISIRDKFTADNMTIKDSNINLSGQLNSKNITMDQSNLTVNNKSSINSDGIIFKNESKLIIESGGQLNSKNMTMDDTSSIISK